MIRAFDQKNDYPTIERWWKEWNFNGVPLDHLPPIGVMANEAAAGFLYLSGTAIVWLEFIVSDKASDKRSESVDEVISALIGMAKAVGGKTIFSSTVNESLRSRLEKHGFQVADRGVIHLAKII